MTRRRRWLAPVAVVALALSACTSSSDAPAIGGDAPTDGEVADILDGLARDVIVPAYVDLAEAMEGFSAATAELCAAPSEAALAEARAAWREATLAWQRTRAVAVGPAMERRLMSAVGFAARPPLVDDLLAGDDPVDAEGLGRQGAAVRGLYAAEHALFSAPSAALAGPDGARRCTYVAAIAEVSGAAAAEVAADWTDGDARAAFVDGDGEGPRASVAALTNQGSRRLEEIDTGGLRDLAAADGPEHLDEDRGDGPAAYRLAERRALAEGVVAVIGDADAGLAALLATTDPDTAERLVAAASDARDAMAALDDSVAGSFDDPDAVARASDAIAELEVLVSTEVASKLGVTITFSDSDGDG